MEIRTLKIRSGFYGGQGWEAMGTNVFGNFWAAHTTGGRAGKPWEPMDLVTFGLHIPLGSTDTDTEIAMPQAARGLRSQH